MRRLGWITALVGLGLGLTASIGRSAEYGMQSVALVIDCSNSMGEAAAGAPGALAADETRMDMTLDVVKSTLTKLAEKGDHRVAIWLYGHRLAWNGSADAPDLQEQTNYLEQTLGFNVLSDLLPGDDVELVRPLTRMQSRDLPQIEMRLNCVQAWGEDPLYLAIVKAVDTFERNSTSRRSIIVVTDGSNHQGMCKFKTDLDRVLDTLEQKAIPVNFLIVPGGDLSRQAEAELQQIASKSGGTFRKTDDGNDLVAQLDDAITGRIATVESTAATTMTPVSTSDDTTARVALKPQTIHGRLVCLSRAVGNVKVTLEGPGGTQSATSNANGDFKFDDLAAGTYTLKCKTIIANVIREGTVSITLDGTASEPVPVELIIR